MSMSSSSLAIFFSLSFLISVFHTALSISFLLGERVANAFLLIGLLFLVNTSNSSRMDGHTVCAEGAPKKALFAVCHSHPLLYRLTKAELNPISFMFIYFGFILF